MALRLVFISALHGRSTFEFCHDRSAMGIWEIGLIGRGSLAVGLMCCVMDLWGIKRLFTLDCSMISQSFLLQ
jgi:hypothetical protein